MKNERGIRGSGAESWQCCYFSGRERVRGKQEKKNSPGKFFIVQRKAQGEGCWLRSTLNSEETVIQTRTLLAFSAGIMRFQKLKINVPTKIVYTLDPYIVLHKGVFFPSTALFLNQDQM